MSALGALALIGLAARGRVPTKVAVASAPVAVEAAPAEAHVTGPESERSVEQLRTTESKIRALHERILAQRDHLARAREAQASLAAAQEEATTAREKVAASVAYVEDWKRVLPGELAQVDAANANEMKAAADLRRELEELKRGAASIQEMMP